MATTKAHASALLMVRPLDLPMELVLDRALDLQMELVLARPSARSFQSACFLHKLGSASGMDPCWSVP
jgi:hypothetical protein